MCRSNSKKVTGKVLQQLLVYKLYFIITKFVNMHILFKISATLNTQIIDLLMLYQYNLKGVYLFLKNL